MKVYKITDELSSEYESIPPIYGTSKGMGCNLAWLKTLVILKEKQVFPSLVSEHDIAPGKGESDHTPVMKKAIKQAWAPILVKALQEAVEKIETLETKVAALEAK